MKKSHLGRIGKTRQIIIHIYIIEKQDKDNVKRVISKHYLKESFRRLFCTIKKHAAESEACFEKVRKR